MTRLEYEAVVAKVGDNEKAMLASIRSLGRATATDLRPVTKSTKTGKPLAYGLTREFGRLQKLGLVRSVPRTRPVQYAVVAMGDVEEAAKVFALRKQRKTKRKGGTRRLAELRAYEHGDYTEFARVQKRVIELSEYLSHQMVRMAFWAAAPKDELARVVKDLAQLISAIDEALVCLAQRADDDDLKAKIEKLMATNGRTEAEAATALALAQKLRTQYEQRVGAGVLD